MAGQRVDFALVAKKSKRNSGPKQGSARAEKLAARQAEREAAAGVVSRPFEGLAAECDLVALREFVPSATAPLPVIGSDRPVTLATVLPGAVAALVRDEGETATGFVGVQVQAHSADLGADLAASVNWIKDAAPGDALSAANPDSETPAVTAVVDPSALLDITVHQNFNWWIPEASKPIPSCRHRAARQLGDHALCTPRRRRPRCRVVGRRRREGAPALGSSRERRRLMLALARVHATGGLHLGEGSRYAGSFRTHGLLVPVFDLDREKHANEWVAATVELGERLAEALAVDAPLTSAELRSRDGLRGRQVTLR